MRSERNACSVRATGARWRLDVAALVVALGCAAPAIAQERTPFGAEVAGNAAGTIPAWDGGLVRPVAGYRSGQPYPDPYRDDKPLFTISAANVEQYRKQLSAGQIALLQKYPTWQMNVYPTRRSACIPATGVRGNGGQRGRGEARARRQRRHRHEGRHSVPGAERRPRGDLEHDAALPRRHVRDEVAPGGGHARRVLHDGRLLLRIRLQLRQSRQAGARPCRQQARLRAGDDHRAGKARQPNAAGG